MTGSEGLLGSEVVAAAGSDGADVVGLGHADLDVTDQGRTREVVGDVAPEWIVHCAAYTAVDGAEDEPAEALRVNHQGTANVSAAAAERGARWLYVSTDYVFDGRSERPYRPDDPVGPLSVYAGTKRAGEEVALSAGALVVRTGWLYGAGGPNFVDAIVQRAAAGEAMRVVDDQRGRPTWARNVARASLELIGGDAGAGIWHVADGGEATWLELAREACAAHGLEVEITGVSTEAWGAAAPRPRYSVLDVSRTEQWLGRPMMPWREALRAYVGERAGSGARA